MASAQGGVAEGAGPSPNDYLEFKTEEAKLLADAEQAKKALKALYKRRKAMRIDSKADKLSYELQDPMLLSRARSYAHWRGSPIPIQDDLPFDKPSEKAAVQFTEAQVKMDGFDAGQKSRPREDNPHEPGSVFHALFDTGWIEGQAKIANEMTRPADQTRKRREPKVAESSSASAPWPETASAFN